MKVLKPAKKIVLQMTEEEATVLVSLAGGVPFNFDTKVGHIVRDFFDALNAELPDRKESFANFFEGQIWVKR